MLQKYKEVHKLGKKNVIFYIFICEIQQLEKEKLPLEEAMREFGEVRVLLM